MNQEDGGGLARQAPVPAKTEAWSTQAVGPPLLSLTGLPTSHRLCTPGPLPLPGCDFPGPPAAANACGGTLPGPFEGDGGWNDPYWGAMGISFFPPNNIRSLGSTCAGDWIELDWNPWLRHIRDGALHYGRKQQSLRPVHRKCE